MIERRLALLFSDGSISLYAPNFDIEKARAEAIEYDQNENDPASFTRIVWVEVSSVEIIETPKVASMPRSASGWRPIDTNTPHGRFLLVRGPSGQLGEKYFVVQAKHDVEYRPHDPWRFVDDTALSDSGWVPTEWMEVPA